MAPNEHSSIDYLVKMIVVLGVFRHAEFKSSLYFGFFVGTLDSFSRFLRHVMFLVETRQSDSAELCPSHKQSEMQ